MRHPTRLVVLLALPVAVVFASSEPGAEDTERNVRLVDKYRREDTVYYERLRRDLRAFTRLPAEKQERMRELDRALHEQDSETQRRLWGVLDRFTSWLDRLPEEQRRRVEEAPTREERLRVIKELREQEFIRHLPKKVREDLDALPAAKRVDEIVRLREEERQVRTAWNSGGRRSGAIPKASRPVRTADLSAEQQQYVNDVLWELLSGAEREELHQAEGQWPAFAKTLLELVEKHQPTGPTRNDALPDHAKPVLRALKKDEKTTLHRAEGKFPEYAQALVRLAKLHKVRLVPPLGPSRLEELTMFHREFVSAKLLPMLDNTDRDELQKAEGSWPDYLQKLLSLAAKYDREIPLLEFPGASELGEKVRSPAGGLPELPDRLLREFFFTELSAEDRAELRLSLDDPESRDRLRQEYFKRYPKALNRLRELDKRRLVRPGGD